MCNTYVKRYVVDRLSSVPDKVHEILTGVTNT